MVFLIFYSLYSSSDDLSGSPGSPIQRLMQEFMPNAPKRPPPRRRRNPDDSGYVPDLDEVPGIPVQLVFLSDSDDSGIIILSSDEYEEESEDNNDNVIIISSNEMEEGSDNNNEDDDLNEAILNSPSPPNPKRLIILENNKMKLQFILKMCIFFSLNLLKLKIKNQ